MRRLHRALRLHELVGKLNELVASGLDLRLKRSQLGLLCSASPARTRPNAVQALSNSEWYPVEPVKLSLRLAPACHLLQKVIRFLDPINDVGSDGELRGVRGMMTVRINKKPVNFEFATCPSGCGQ